MKKLLLLALFSGNVATAGPIENMVVRCNSAMEQGVCRVALDPRNYPNTTINFAGVGEVLTSSYLRIRNTGEKKDSRGRWQMCVTAQEACSALWDGDDCRAVRAMWRQTPL